VIARAQQPTVLDFLAGNYSVPYTISMADIYGNGSVQPLGLRNDGFGVLIQLPAGGQPPGLETILFPVLVNRRDHRGRVNRDVRLADFNNDGFPDVVSNTYDCVDPLNPDDIARVYRNNGDGTFTEVSHPFRDAMGNPIDLRGRGETIVVADFNNDGFLDIFLPYYPWTDTNPASNPDPFDPTSSCPNATQSYLLLNDGTGHFTDVSAAAGLTLATQPKNYEAEGVQAADFNNDGLIDLYAGSHLFINNGIVGGIPRFMDQAAVLGLPHLPDQPFSDEGAKFIDAYNDGFLSLVLLSPSQGPALFRYDGARFTRQSFPIDSYQLVYGMNAYDLNNDGLDDLVVVGGLNYDPKIVLNTGSGFVRAMPVPRPLAFSPATDVSFGLGDGRGAMAFGDVNNDGKIDMFYSTDGVDYFINNSTIHNPFFVIELLGPNGEQNQQGRIVRISPQANPAVIYTRVVDGGSGYLSQNQYPLLIGSRFAGAHTVTISLPRPGATSPNNLVNISFTIQPGQKARVFAPSTASPGGRVELQSLQKPVIDPALFLLLSN
jgi:hypothetical protein